MKSCDRITLLSITSILIFLRKTNAELVTKPTDTEVLVGDLTYFNCSSSVTSEEIHWFHYLVGNIKDRNFVYAYNQLYNGYKDRFIMEKSEANRSYNLFITSVKIQDAGRYECQDKIGRGAKASARLIVLDQSPICQSNHKTNEVIGPNECNIPLGDLQLSCSAIYYGDDSPALKWFQNGSDEPLVDGFSSSASGNRVQSNLTMKAGSTIDGASFQCQTTRSKLTSIGCKSGSFTIIGASATCNKKPLADAIFVTWFLLIPIIIAGSILLGIFLQKHFGFKIFNRLESRKNIENQDAAKEKAEEIVLLEMTEEEKEPEVMPENIEKATGDRSEQYEQLRKNTSDIMEQKNKKIRELENKNKQLEHEKLELEHDKLDLEGRLYPLAITSLDVKPTLVKVIEITEQKAVPKKEKKPIFGMTILHSKLYIVTEKSSDVAIHDSVTFNRETTWNLEEMSNPQDIASCNTNDCLYICDGEYDKETFILRVDSSGTALMKWPIGEDEGRLSVTRETNVVVSLFKGNKINEYSSDGTLIKTVRLSPADNISHPWHAIKTTSMHFLFSHGIGDDKLQRVCVADLDGKIKKSFGGKKGEEIKQQQMNRPVHLLEDSSRNVLVADMKNKRVLLLSPTLEFKRILLDRDNLRFPMKLCVDEKNGILFVADNNHKEGACTYENGRILIFSFKMKERK